MILNAHSYYSLRYGTIKPEDLLLLAKQGGYRSFGLCDINSTSACLEYIRLSEKYNIKPIIGVDFRNGAKQEFVLIAQNNLGFQNINAYLSKFLHQVDYEIPYKARQLQNVITIYPFSKCFNENLKENEYLGVNITDLNTKEFLWYKGNRGKLIILHTVTFVNKKGFNTHRLLRAIDNNTLLSKLPIAETGSPENMFLSYEDLTNAYSDYDDLIINTEEIVRNCKIEFDFSQQTPNNQSSYTSNKALDFKLLKRLVFKGLSYRYDKVTNHILDRINKELQIIEKKDFVSYFLINWKILKYARSKGYFYVGRGSGANSVIAYLLRITDVDPIELDLYFERFINLYRTNPPDFDIDFSWKDRDDITKFIFRRFKNTALISVYNTFKYKASVRELGKVFGLPKSEIDILSSGYYDVNRLDKLSQLVLVYSKLINGFPNYLGIHAGGIIISEKPIHYYTATFMPPKGFSTTQFDMIIAEDIGLYKFDILSQRGLGKIKDTVDIVKYNHPKLQPLDIHDLKRFKQDKRIKKLLKNAKAIGCFYVESPAMRMLLKKLKVDNYLGLVAASSVIRPGVSKSGMMKEYILRYRYPERRNKAHPVLLNIMPDTYGVMVYQEDVIKVAHYFGGLSLGEADMLRRGMSGKFRSREEFLKVKEQFFINCKNDGKDESLTKEIWRQIESFAGYAFAKGHSASYAVESYQSLFLKAYFPLEYMVATLNNGGGFYSVELYVHEARMNGGVIQAPCINRSYNHTVIYGNEIFIGFGFLHSFESNNSKNIIKERLKNGDFISLDDFIDRVSISIEQLAILIKINAFRFMGIKKRVLLWEAYMKINKVTFEEHKLSLFKTKRVSYKMPDLPSTTLEDAFDEIELLGFPLCNPFDLLAEPQSYLLKAIDLYNYIGREVNVLGYLVVKKRTSTSNGKQMYFGTFLDYDGYFIDTVHFPHVSSKYPFRGRGVYKIKGKVLEEFDCLNIEVIQMEKLAIVEDPRYSDKVIN
jgi:DNA polymerase-3 subunit alpha